MKFLILISLFILSADLLPFRLSEVTNTANEDILPKALVRWSNAKKHSINMGKDGSDCTNVSDTTFILKSVIQTLNSIEYADFTIGWSDSFTNHDITIISKSASEWAALGHSAGILGLAEFNAECSKNTECAMTTATVTLNCAQLASDPDGSKVDYFSVLLHETIHNLGLDHTGTRSAVMYPSITYGSTDKRSLTEDDEAGLVFLYPHKGPEGSNYARYLVCGKITGNRNFTNTDKLQSSLPLIICMLFFIVLRLRKKRYFNAFI